MSWPQRRNQQWTLAVLLFTAAHSVAAMEVHVVMPQAAQSSESSWLCTSIQMLAEDGQLQLINVTTQLSPQLVDAMAVYSCDAPISSDPVWRCDIEGSLCASAANQLYRWDAQASLQGTLRPGQIIGGTSHPRFLVGRMHFTAARPEADQSGFALLLQSVPTAANAQGFGADSASIKGHGQKEDSSDNNWEEREDELEREEEVEEELVRLQEEAQGEEEVQELQLEWQEQELELALTEEFQQTEEQAREAELAQELMEEEEDLRQELEAEQAEAEQLHNEAEKQEALVAEQAEQPVKPQLSSYDTAGTLETTVNPRSHTSPQVAGIALCSVAVAGCFLAAAVYMLSRKPQTPQPDNDVGFCKLKQPQGYAPRSSIGNSSAAESIEVEVDIEGGHQPSSLVWSKKA